MLVNPNVGLLFIDLEKGNRLRLDGTASILHDDSLWRRARRRSSSCGSPSGRCTRNCPRYIHRFERLERSPFVPQAGAPTPIPDWKRADWAADALPAGDPARS